MIIEASKLGQTDTEGKRVDLDVLIDRLFYLNRLGVYVPSNCILKISLWFASLTAQEAMASDTYIGKLLLCKCSI